MGSTYTRVHEHTLVRAYSHMEDGDAIPGHCEHQCAHTRAHVFSAVMFTLATPGLSGGGLPEPFFALGSIFQL